MVPIKACRGCGLDRLCPGSRAEGTPGVRVLLNLESKSVLYVYNQFRLWGYISFIRGSVLT